MLKTDNRHYNRHTKRLLAIEMNYYTGYIRKQTQHGIVTDVKYSGNTVYGNVYLLINADWYLMVVDKHRPALKDLDKAILVKTTEPENILN